MLRVVVYLFKNIDNCKFFRLLHAQTVYCLFDQASDTYHKASALVEQMANINQAPNLAGLYAEFSVLYFFRSQYDEVSNF